MVERTNFGDLEPEYFQQKQFWVDFMEEVSNTLQSQIREPIGEIEDIRHIVENTDPKVISNTIKMLGFNIPADLIKHNSERLAKSVYMLSLFHEIAGTDDFVRSIQFVLGREVQVDNLYTRDYEDFYEKPYGPMIQDGGDWYLTTHIMLGIEVVPTDVDMVLPENETLASRLIAAYFEFAPINQVVYEFYYKVKLAMSLGINGVVRVDPIEFRTIGTGNSTVQQVRNNISKQVVGGQREQVMTDVRLDSELCYDIQMPVWGYGPSDLSTDQDITDYLTGVLDNTYSQNIAFDPPEGMFSYIAVPSELGEVFFTEVSTNVEGGWDGANWTGDEINDDNGPLEVQRTRGSEVFTWNLYRSDLPSVKKTFSVEFENSGITNTCDDSPEIPEQETQILGLPEGCKKHTVNLLPVYGIGDHGINSDSSIDTLTEELPNTGNQGFTISVPSDKYGYFAYPAVLGSATFIDRDSGVEGGWGGASWPKQDVRTELGPGTNLGPIVVKRTYDDIEIDWLLYRTDFPKIGNKTFDVIFSNAGADTSIDCVVYEEVPEEDECLSSYPFIARGPIDVGDDAEREILPDTSNREFSLFLHKDEYGYFAYPAELGSARLIDTSNGDENGWNRVYDGGNNDWSIYRTVNNGLGHKTFRVEFDYPNQCVSSDAESPGGDISTNLNISTDKSTPKKSSTLKDKCRVSSFPKYGSSSEQIIDEEQMELLTKEAVTESQIVTLDVKDGEYGYFAYPAALGEATFTDPDVLETGGWDGATWPDDGSMGSNTGPLLITVDGTDWFVYRTNNHSLGVIDFTVDFENPGLLLGQEVVFDTSSYIKHREESK